MRAQKRAAPTVKLALALLGLAGLALIINGLIARRLYEQSGFSGEGAFQAIYRLAEGVERDWNALLSPALAALPTEKQDALDELAKTLLTDFWQGRAGDGADIADFLPAPGDREALRKLLYISYTVAGPKLSSAVKKAAEGAGAGVSAALLEAALDEAAPVPEFAGAALAKLSGTERQSMLMMLHFQSLARSSALRTEDVNNFKKGVRDKAMQLEAFRMIADGEMTPLRQFVMSRSRTVVLVGVLLTLDSLLLAFLMAADRVWRFDFKWGIILAIVDFLLLFQLMPLLYTVVKAFFPDGHFSLETFRRLYSYSLNFGALKNTLIAAFATMIVGTLFAFPLAWLIGRTNLCGRRFFRSLFVLTYMVPPYVGAMAWLRLLNPNVGTVNLWLRALLHLGSAPGPLNVYSLPGLIWVLSTFYYPYAFITISRAMEKMDPSLEEAARAAGASPLKALLSVTLPLMTPSLIAGALLVFVSAASCYGIPSIIGVPGRVHTVTTRIVEYVSLGQQGLNDATGLSVFLLLLALLILFVSDIVLAKRQYITVSGKSTQPALVDLRAWRVPLTVLVSLFAVVVILVPFATIFATSFKIDVGKSMFLRENFTLTNWKTIFGRSETMSCLKNSLLYATVTATIGILVACTMSYLLQRTRIRGRRLPDFLITLGSGTPSVVIALSLIMTMKGGFGVNIYNTAYIMIIAYLIKYLMMGMRTVVSAMSQVHVSLEESSQISGASWLRTMFRITGRLIFPSIAAGWFLIFIPSFYELSMTTLLYSSTTKTIGFQLYEYWTFTSQPMACAMAFGILLFVVLLNFLLGRLTRGQFSI